MLLTSAEATVLARSQQLPVVPALEGFLQDGALQRGTVVGIGGPAGATSLALAMAAGASQAGSWTGAIGFPALGLVAAAELGIDLARFALVPAPGSQWATVTAALLDALDVVVVHPPGRVRSSDARRLAARARERGAVLVVHGDQRTWPETPPVRLTAVSSEWDGIGSGYGHLRQRRFEVVVTGRGSASRERRATAELEVRRAG